MGKITNRKGMIGKVWQSCLLIVFLCFLASFGSHLQAQNLYSGATGNYNAITWYTDAGRTISCGCTPGASNTLNIGNTHNVTIPSGSTVTFAGLVVQDAGASGTLTIGSTNVAASVTFTGDLTIFSSGSVLTAGGGAATHTLTIGGNISNGNIFNMVNGGNVTNVIFNGGVAKALSGSGPTFTFNNLSLNAGGNNLNINSSIRVNGTIAFTAVGLLVVNSTSNITISASSTITGYDATHYVQLDESNTLAGGQLIRTNNNTVAAWQFFFPIGSATGGYNPVDLTVATVTTAPANNATLGVKPIIDPSDQGQLRRTIKLTVTGNGNATTFSSGNFYYNAATDVATGDVLANYGTGWYLNNATGVWTVVTGTAPGVGFFTSPATAQSLATGTFYYTIGTSTGYPQTWYTYQTGNWSDPNVWTTDPSGQSLVNPLSSAPHPGDNVVIVNGFTVTSDINNITCGATTIQGGAILDMSTTTSHNLGAIDGTGLLRINGINLPNGTYTTFVSAIGGTIEYYNTGGTLPTSQTTYNKLILSNSSNFTITFVTTTNFTVNSTMNVTQSSGSGTVTWQVNDGTAAQRTMTINGDLTVSANALITAGTGGAAGTPHSLTLNGNLVNNGTVKFFDPTDAVLSVANYTSGAVYTSALRGNAVKVTFSGLTNNTVTANNTTDFYRLVLNKGTGQQAILTINPSAAANFRLFGPNNIGSNTGAAPNEISDCALSIANGTLQLTGSTNIPRLNSTGGTGNDYFSIPQNGALWINGASVSVTVANNSAANPDQRLMLDGLLRVTAGSLVCGYTKGIGSGDAGILLIEGGTVTMFQFRPRAGSATQAFVYNQTGGTVNVGTTGYNGTPSTSGVNNTGYGRISLPVASCTFQMSGGILNVGQPTSNNPGGIEIASSASNYSVTGGTVNAYIPTAGSNFTINSTAPFANLNVYKEGGGALVAQLSAALVIQNNLTLITTNSPTFNCNAQNLTIGGNIDGQAGTTLTNGANTVTFNGAGAQSWTHNGTITSLNNVVVNKSAGTLTLGGSGVFPTISGALTLTSGTLADGGKTVTVSGAITNNATHSGAGSIVVSAATTIGGNNGTFGNLTITTNGTVATSGTQTISGTLALNGSTNTILNIASYSLTALGSITTSGTFGANYRIQTSGLHNASGLTRKATSGVDLLFPFGTSPAATNYTPITINVTATTAGNITARPVVGAHPNVTTITQSVQYYWRVTSSGFVGISAVQHKNYTYATATRDAFSVSYRPARYDGTAFFWSYGPVYDATSGAGLTTIPNFNTGTGWTALATDQLDGEYTAGLSTAFGAVTVYYSSSTPGAWGLNTSWSITSVNHAADAGSTPCATCPVIIGDASNNHTITISANSQKSGTLTIANGSTLDCGAFTGLSFGANTGGTVLGRGTLRIGAVNFPAGDFTNFIGANGGTVEWYGAANYTIPSVGPAPQNLSLSTYYNIIVTPTGAATISMPANDLNVYGTFAKSGTSILAGNATANRVLIIGGDLNIANGIFALQQGASYNITVGGNTTVSTGATLTLGGTGARTHTLTTSGSITNNGTILFRNTAHVLNLTMTGFGNTNFTGAATSSTLNLLTVNKGTSQSSVLTFDVTGALSTLSNAWLTLTNGTIVFNNSAYALTLTNVAATNYTIPSTAKLKVSAGTVNIGAVASNTSDLILAGALEVAGGTVNVGSAANTNNNDIEYASAGFPSITVSSGTLYVNGAIRRSTIVLSGSLVYNQSGGTVQTAGKACNVAPNSTRGVFEIESNTGSSFTMTGGTLTVSRPTGGSNFTDLYLNPASNAVTSAGTIQVGDNALGAQTLDINIVPHIGNLIILGAAGNAQTVNMASSELYTQGNLTINTASILNTNSLNVHISGDMSVTGTYNGTIGTGNTTFFDGTIGQAATLSATSTFNNMTVSKTTGTVLTLAGTAPTVTDLNILTGNLDVATLNLIVIGNITNNSTQLNTGGGSLSLAGTAAVTVQNITSGNGVFGNISIAGLAASKVVNLSGNTTINGTLNFSVASRFFSIGSNRLTFGASAAVTGAGASDFVRTNGTSSDLGVVKNWSVAGATSFTYPVGTLNNYTPATYTLTITTAGALTVVPVNSRHPTYNTASSEQVLNYYWIVSEDNSIIFANNGSQQYQYPSSLVGGAGGTLVAAYLDIDETPLGWNTTDPSGVATTTNMTFTNSLNTNMPASPPAASDVYHYTVGTINTLPSPIAAVYSRTLDANTNNLLVGGSWNSVNSWTNTVGGSGPPVLSVPNGVPIVIVAGTRINTNGNSRLAFTSVINGTLVIATTFGHNLGAISGTGTLQTATNTFPGGTYTSFVSPIGGTIEYVAPMTMNARTTYNNIKVSGAGTLTLTNSDITLNGGLNVSAVGITLDNSVNNRNITIAKDWANSGTFSPGTGTVTFNGTVAQGITGATTFNNLSVNKTGNLTLNSVATVNGVLTLAAGNVISNAYPAASFLSLALGSSISGGSATSFIDGQIKQVLASGSTVTHPLGSNATSRYRPIVLTGTGGPVSDTWTSSYIAHNPLTDGYSFLSFNGANMAKVSQYEYWQVANTSGTATAGLTLSFGPGSYGGANIGNLASLKTARWNGTQWDIPPGGGTFSQTGNNAAGTVSVSFQNAFSPQAIATDDVSSTLPVELTDFTVALVDGPAVDLKWTTASELNNALFTIERSADSELFEEVGSLKGQGTKNSGTNYSYLDSSPLNGRSYYRLKQTDFDGRHSYSDVKVVDNVSIGVYPNPVRDKRFTFELNNAQASELVIVRVISVQGISVYEASYRADETGHVKQDVEMSGVASGLYIVKIISTSGLTRKVFVE